MSSDSIKSQQQIIEELADKFDLTAEVVKELLLYQSEFTAMKMANMEEVMWPYVGKFHVSHHKIHELNVVKPIMIRAKKIRDGNLSGLEERQADDPSDGGDHRTDQEDLET